MINVKEKSKGGRRIESAGREVKSKRDFFHCRPLCRYRLLKETKEPSNQGAGG